MAALVKPIGAQGVISRFCSGRARARTPAIHRRNRLPTPALSIISTAARSSVLQKWHHRETSTRAFLNCALIDIFTKAIVTKLVSSRATKDCTRSDAAAAAAAALRQQLLQQLGVGAFHAANFALPLNKIKLNKIK